MKRLVHSVDYSDKDYIALKTGLNEGYYTFQIAIESEGLVIDIFRHVGDDNEHISTTTAWYEDLNIEYSPKPSQYMDLEEYHNAETEALIEEARREDGE